MGHNTHVIEALQRARVLIAAGWCQQVARDDNRYCIIGALAEATTTEQCSSTVGYLVWRNSKAALEQHLPEPWPNLVTYNDDVTTTQRNVLDLIDTTIADLSGVEQ